MGGWLEHELHGDGQGDSWVIVWCQCQSNCAEADSSRSSAGVQPIEIARSKSIDLMTAARSLLDFWDSSICASMNGISSYGLMGIGHAGSPGIRGSAVCLPMTVGVSNRLPSSSS